ncbi:MAG: hypothetical protein RLW62_08585, partial [Gammaproteobacteria bacterium]
VAAPALVALLQGFPRQALHAGRLAFAHPLDGTPLEITAPWPADLTALVDALAADTTAHG